MSADDPLSLVYTALWDMAEQTSYLTNQVKLSNRIRYDTHNRNPEKKTILDADAPELALMCSGFSGNLCANSSSSMITARYSWIVITGDLRVNYRLLPVEWGLFLAMHKWRTVLGALTWQDKVFVKKLNMLDVQEGILQQERPQTVPRGWSSVWGIEVGMYFDLTDLGAQ